METGSVALGLGREDGNEVNHESFASVLLAYAVTGPRSGGGVLWRDDRATGSARAHGWLRTQSASVR